MRALILAAGMGSRLGYKTKNKPKALVKINSQEILSHQLNQLKELKIKDVCIVIGYKSKKIIDFLKKKNFFRFTIIKNNLFRTTDSAYSYHLTKKFILGHDYIHLNCDIIFQDKVLKKIVNSKKKNILSTRSDLKLGQKMDLIKTKNSKITKFDNIYFPNASCKVFGIAKINKSLSKKLIKMIDIDIKKNLLKKKCFSYFKYLCKTNIIYSMKFNKKDLIEINTLNDIKKNYE